MKRVIILMVIGLIALYAESSANEGYRNPITIPSEMLSNDPEFKEVVNLIFDFSINVAQTRKTDALLRYVNKKHTAEDIKALNKETGKFTDVENLFSRIAFLKASISNKFPSLQVTESGQLEVAAALKELAAKKEIKKVRHVDVDCLASYMAAISVCWWAYDQCMINGGDCIGQQMACFALAAIWAQTCFGIIPD